MIRYLIITALTLSLLLGSCISQTESKYIYTNGAIEVGADGKPIELINNRHATDPTYAELLAFIEKDTTDELPYVSFSRVCADFAEMVYNNAEKAGIRAAWVGIDLKVSPLRSHEGHALNAFETTDKGLVYIDCTGRDLLNLTSLSTPNGYDKVAYVSLGKECGFIDITKAESPAYSFYEEYKQKSKEYENLKQEHETLMDELRAQVELNGSADWPARLDEIRERIAELSEELGDHWYEPLGIVNDIQIHWKGG
jgi:hypothetical protein